MAERKTILYCCGCEKRVFAVLTYGKSIYPHRRDLARTPFWRCETCTNFVGTHYKSRLRAKPLGCIPTPEIRALRREIHAILDPIWQTGNLSRPQIYKCLSEELGYSYHTAEIRTVFEARKVLDAVIEIKNNTVFYEG